MDDVNLAQLQQKAEQASQDEMMRENILRSVCRPEALERLKRVKLVKRELVEQIEKLIQQQAVNGKLRGQIQESDVIDLLNKLGGSTSTSSKQIEIQRKKYTDDDEDDSDSDLK